LQTLPEPSLWFQVTFCSLELQLTLVQCEPGDVVEVEVEGLGKLTNTIVTGPTAIELTLAHSQLKVKK
jgi:hypothetical protein